MPTPHRAIDPAVATDWFLIPAERGNDATELEPAIERRIVDDEQWRATTSFTGRRTSLSL